MPDPRVIESRTDSRSTVLRRAVILTPAAVILLALLAVSATGLPYSILPVLVLLASGGAMTYEAVAALRDLWAQPVTTTGMINRLWKKSRFLFMGRVDYALVDGQLFEVSAPAALELRDGDEVAIEHWPHTNTVISLALVSRGSRSQRR